MASQHSEDCGIMFEDYRSMQSNSKIELKLELVHATYTDQRLKRLAIIQISMRFLNDLISKQVSNNVDRERGEAKLQYKRGEMYLRTITECVLPQRLG